MQKLKVLELFAGIGACSKALERLNIPHEIVDAVEIDKYAIQSFNAIHGTNFEPQDITAWDKDIKVDLIMHGSPCQDFSLAGKQAGGDKDSGTRSSLMYETIRIVEKLKPKYVVWENVKNLLSKKHRHNFDAYLETLKQLGYKNYYQVLNAKDYGIPQSRERVFTISIRNDIDKDFHFPEKQPLELRLKDLLDDKVDEKYYLSDAQVNRIKTSTYTSNNRRIQKKDYCDTLCARDWKDPKCVEVNRLYGIFDNEQSKHQAGSVYDTDGLSPTLDTMQGGWRQPCVEVDFVSKKYNEFVDKKGYIPDMYNPYNNSEIKDIAPTQSTQCGSTTSSSTVLIRNKSLRETLEQNNIEKDISFIDSYNRNIRKDDLSGTITTRVSDSNNTFIAIKNATKQGYLEAHDGDGCYISNIDKKRGTVQKEMIPTLKTSPDIGVVVKDVYSDESVRRIRNNIIKGDMANTLSNCNANGDKSQVVLADKTICLNSKGGRNGIEGLQPSLKDRVYDSNGIATCCATSNFFMPNYTDGLRIRKLTEKECLKLMGFDDEDYEKIKSIGISRSQIYKQAGNSIVVTVIEAIFKELFSEYIPNLDKWSDLD